MGQKSAAGVNPASELTRAYLPVLEQDKNKRSANLYGTLQTGASDRAQMKAPRSEQENASTTAARMHRTIAKHTLSAPPSVPAR